MHFATMAEWLAPAKVQYACSAHFLDHLDGLNLSSDQQKFLKEIPDPIFAESVRDFMTNQQFRRDYWVKGARSLSTLEQAEALREQKIVLVGPRSEISLKLNGSQGEATMSEAVYNPLLDVLADNQTKKLADLEASGKSHNISFPQILEATLALMGAGHVAPAQEESVIQSAEHCTNEINSYLINKARSGADINHLASPVTGGGVTLGRFQQLFILAISQGHKRPDHWAQFGWEILANQNQKIIKDGRLLETQEENIEELLLQAKGFQEKHLPALKALRLV